MESEEVKNQKREAKKARIEANMKAMRERQGIKEEVTKEE